MKCAHCKQGRDDHSSQNLRCPSESGWLATCWTPGAARVPITIYLEPTQAEAWKRLPVTKRSGLAREAVALILARELGRSPLERP